LEVLSFSVNILIRIETITASNLGNRKFDKGKLSKKAAELLNEESERAYESYLASAEGQQTEELLRKHREKRGVSLVQRHLEGSSKRSKVDNAGFQFFDRDRVCFPPPQLES
jgi:hypothetical protein